MDKKVDFIIYNLYFYTMKPRLLIVKENRFKWWVRSNQTVVIQSPFGKKYIFPINEVSSENMAWDIFNEYGGKVKPSDVAKIIEQKKLV